MISECFNPACRKKLEYLRSGKVIGVVRQNGPKVEIEHFWLCGDCHKQHDLRLLADGTVVLKPYQVGPSNTSSRAIHWPQRRELTA
jgi:hypothetical protein